MNERLTPTQIWAAPIVLGLASAVGLIAALLSDGLGDVLSWAALAAPVATVLWHSLRPQKKVDPRAGQP